MTIATRSRLAILAGAALVVCLLVVGGAPAPAATSPRITPTGVGAVRLGSVYGSLRAAHLVARIGPGCALEGPSSRAAALNSPLRGAVKFTNSAPRKVKTIFITGGARAHGVGVGSTQAAVKSAFPKAKFDHSTDGAFGVTVAKVPKGAGGPLGFAIDVKTKLVTTIGIPRIEFCE